MYQSYIESAVALISMNKSQESAVFDGRQKLIYAMKLRPEK